MLRARTAVTLLVLAGLTGPVERGPRRSGAAARPARRRARSAPIGPAQRRPMAWRVPRTSSSAPTGGTSYVAAYGSHAVAVFDRGTRPPGGWTSCPADAVASRTGTGPCAPGRALAPPVEPSDQPGRCAMSTSPPPTATRSRSSPATAGPAHRRQLCSARRAASASAPAEVASTAAPSTSRSRWRSVPTAAACTSRAGASRGRGRAQPRPRRHAHPGSGRGGLHGVRGPRRLRQRSCHALSRGRRGQPRRPERLCGSMRSNAVVVLRRTSTGLSQPSNGDGCIANGGGRGLCDRPRAQGPGRSGHRAPTAAASTWPPRAPTRS